MTRRLHRPDQPRFTVGLPPASALLAAIPNPALEMLFSLQLLLGNRSEWPGWALHAVTGEKPDVEYRAEFAVLLHRAWPTARGSARQALEHVAAHFRVALPASETPLASRPMRRSRPSPEQFTDELEDAAVSANKAGSP